MSASEEAIQAFRDVVGADNVRVDADARRRAETATFATARQVVAIVRPGSTAEVQACARIAGRLGVRLYPVSKGKNWGLGSRVPTCDGAIVLQLDRMDRIVDFDEDLAYVAVEPGVTFRALRDFLRARGSRLMTTVVGSTGDASVLGNAVERGHGQGPYSDRFAQACAFEVVLPGGDCIHTGMSRFPSAPCSNVYRWGVGPSLDGLFSQSNLGIVTRATMWLLPRPRHFQLAVVVAADDDLAPLLGWLRERRFDDRIHVQFERFERRRMERTPISFLVEAFLPRGSRYWIATIGVFADSREEGAAKLATLKRTKPVALGHLWSFSNPTLARQVSPALGDHLDPDRSEFLGNPPGCSPTASEWYNVDYDRDAKTGLVWMLPVMPFAAVHVRRVVEILDQVTAGAFEQRVCLRALSPRALDLVAGIRYDRSVEGEDARAMDWHASLLARLTEEGYIPYRLGIQSMDGMPRCRDDYGALLRTLKRALDPDDILAPGRYDFRGDWTRPKAE